jgi:O-antigen/teichoic acid export membrane protein
VSSDRGPRQGAARGLFANSAFALVGDLAAKSATALVMVAAARGLPVAQLALLAFGLASASVLASALDLGGQMLMTRDGVGGGEQRAALARALIIGRLPAVVVCLLVAAGLGMSTGKTALALLIVLYAVLAAGQMLLTGILRSAQDLLPEATLKLLGGALTLAACAGCVAVSADADGFIAALSLALALTIAAGGRAALRVLVRGARLPARAALRASAPLGLMTLATLVYYRSGTLGLTILSTPGQTARFATASTVGFALLMVPNAITTGLLPKLSATPPSGHPALMRRAVSCAVIACVSIAVVIAVAARPLLVGLFGARYGNAAPALRVLAASTALIGPTGVLGTLLIARRRLRPISLQVGASLIGNIFATLVLVPRCGAVGAALATLTCEVVAMLITARACARIVPGLFALAPTRPWSSAPAEPTAR